MLRSSSVSQFFIYLKTLIGFAPRRFYFSCILSVISTFLSSAGLLMLIPLLHYVSWLPGVEGSSHSLLKGIVSFLPQSSTSLGLVLTLLMFICLIAGVAAVDYWQGLVSTRFNQGYLFSLRQRLNLVVAQATWSYLLARKLKAVDHMLSTG
ncbi:MAG: hypothetical protein HYX35_04630, partial [Proteobacteria bacterium]|nr:hypothetical protein [Pseudomonadota bacterium]